MKNFLLPMLALAATTVSAQNFTATPAEGSTISSSQLSDITLTWPEGTEVSVDLWGSYMEIKTLASYEADMNDDLFWEYVGYGFGDSWEVNGSSVTIHPDYYEITEDGTYVVVIEVGSLKVNGELTDRIALKYDVVSDAAPKIDLTVAHETVNGCIALQIPEGYTLSSVAEDASMVITDGDDYVCEATVAACEEGVIYLSPATTLAEGRYYVSVMPGSFLFNDDTVANAYLYSAFTFVINHEVAISTIGTEQQHQSYNLMGMRTHTIGRGLHVVNGKVIIK